MYILKECVYKQTPSHMLLGFLQRKRIKSNIYQALQPCIGLWEFLPPFSGSLNQVGKARQTHEEGQASKQDIYNKPRMI